MKLRIAKLFKAPPSENFFLKVNPAHVELLCSLPDFRNLSTEQLYRRLPSKYRVIVPPARVQDRETRAAIIGMLALPMQIESHVSMRFIERSFTPEGK